MFYFEFPKMETQMEKEKRTLDNELARLLEKTLCLENELALMMMH